MKSFFGSPGCFLVCRPISVSATLNQLSVELFNEKFTCNIPETAVDNKKHDRKIDTKAILISVIFKIIWKFEIHMALGGEI